MNDYINNLLNDLYIFVDNLIELSVIDKSFNKKNISIDYFSNSKKGDVSSNLYIILNKNKIDTNFDLYDFLLNKINSLDYIKDVNISKSGFINFFYNSDYIFNNLNYILKENSNYGTVKIKNKNIINIEFVSANPTGPVTIAHMRGAVYGDVLSNILQKIGYKIVKEYYVNDTGSQIEILGNSLYKRYQEIEGIKVEFNEKEYPGKYLIDIAKKIHLKYKDQWLKEENHNRKKFFQNFAITNIINSITTDLNQININFDIFTHESDIINKKLINKVFEILKINNLIYEGTLDKPKGDIPENWESRKQLLFKSTTFDDEVDRPFKKADGSWTYFANDSAYHFDKISRKYNKLINIWGADHTGYINRMKSIVDVLSNKKNYLEIKICQIVRLLKNGKVYKMSKREGKFITINEIVKKVGVDPLRYFMISTKNETPIDFDLNKVIEKNKDNPVFYCQYAYARASSVINKAIEIKEFKNFDKYFDKFDHTFISSYEKEIIFKIISWPYVLHQSATLMQPHRITNYIEDLSSHFHSFWNRGKENKDFRFLDNDNPLKTISKLIWIQSMRIVLKNAFDIIGIQSHESM